MRDITIRHRQLGHGYLLTIDGVQETFLLGADDLAFIHAWCLKHQEEWEEEARQEQDEIARRLLDETEDKE